MSKALKRQSSLYSVIVPDEIKRKEAKGFLNDSEIQMSRNTPHFIEPKHSLRNTHPELLELGLTEEQKIALNSWSYFGGPMPDVLTEEQKMTLEKLKGESFLKRLARKWF